MRFFTPIILLLIAAGLFFGLTAPLFADLDGLRLEKQRADKDLADALALQERFNMLNDQANAIKRSDLDSLQAMLPPAVDAVDLLVKINGIAKNSSLALSDVKVREAALPKRGSQPVTGSVNTITMNFSVSGQYNAFKQFLGNLERSLRLADITAITFNSVDNGVYEYSIELKTYWLK